MRKLIKKIKTGDTRAFRKLYNLHKDDAFGACFSICKHREDAEEACQNGFIRIYKNIHSLESPDSFKSWMYKIMINCSYNVVKRRKEYDDFIESSTEISKDYLDGSSIVIVIAALKELPDGYRTVFILRFFQELKHVEIGRILDISETTSRSQYHHAKQKLKTIITEEMEMSFE